MSASPASDTMLPDAMRIALRDAQAQVNTLVLGKPQQVRLAFVALLADGHLLIEDLPGLGKTTLAHAMAATLGLGFQRVQFTSDLLPADILGVSVYEAQARRFEFHPGPVFTHVLLADEINRAPPRTQSALLEAMAEHQVSIDGETRKLPDPFLVIATQNPVDLAGTYPLPDSQLDRFLLRLALGYPDESAERALLAGSDRRDLIAQAAPLLDAQRVIALRRMVLEVHASEPLIAYVQALVDQGETTEEEAAIHPKSNVLLGCLGTEEEPRFEPHFIPQLQIGDSLLACSDGLWHYFTTEELGSVLNSLPPREASEFLVDKARARAMGGGDNLSLAIVKVEPLVVNKPVVGSAFAPLR